MNGAKVVKGKPTDYETKTAHKIVARVTDNGNPNMFVSFNLPFSERKCKT